MNTPAIPRAAGGAAAKWGWTLSGLAIALLLVDAAAKLTQLAPVLQATAELGYPLETVPWIGAALLAGVVLYALPRTALWGALLLTAYMGGAVASHVRIDSPLFSHVLFSVYVAVVVWAGLALRRPALVALLRGR